LITLLNVIIITSYDSHSNRSFQITTTFIRLPFSVHVCANSVLTSIGHSFQANASKEQVAKDLKVGTFVHRRSTQLVEQIFSSPQTTNLILSYKYPQFMLRLNSNNQIVSMYFYDNKKQTTIVNSSCHFKPIVNH
jgi:hypothetical protein